VLTGLHCPYAVREFNIYRCDYDPYLTIVCILTNVHLSVAVPVVIFTYVRAHSLRSVESIDGKRRIPSGKYRRAPTTVHEFNTIRCYYASTCQTIITSYPFLTTVLVAILTNVHSTCS
jgi:hypothetical protein